MEFKLPSIEDTQIKIVTTDPSKSFTVDILELDDVHGDAVTLSKKTNQPFYEMFASIFQERFGHSISKTAAFLLLQFKGQKLDELKKNCFQLQSSVDSTDSLQDSTDD